MTEYVHKVYGTAGALLRDPDGTVRKATPEELEKLHETYEPALEQSFVAPKS